MELAFGTDLGDVHINTDASAAALAASKNTPAVTVGSDVYFAPGKYAPETPRGRGLLAHELAHVVQQRSPGGDPVEKVEAEAEATAARVTRGDAAAPLNAKAQLRAWRAPPEDKDDEDVSGGGSVRLVDDIVAWGDLDQVGSRIRAHFEAGADHVCVQVIAEDPRALPMAEWRALADQLLR